MGNDVKTENRLPISSPERFKNIYLALAFVCLILVLSISIYVIKNQAYRDLISYIENTSEQITDAICYTDVDAISINGNVDVKLSAFDYLDTKIRDTYDALGVLSITIFNADSVVEYSSNKKLINTTSNNELLAKALSRATIQSVYISKADIIDLYGEKRAGIDVLNVYVPVKDANGKSIGAFLILSGAGNLKTFYEHQLISSITTLVLAILSISFVSLLIIIQQTNKLKSAYKLLEAYAHTDGLTGLYNRSFYEEELDRLAVSRRYPIGIIIIDLDGLKNINDTYGHSAGDKIICKAADILKITFRGDDLITRTGGDEFTILLPNTTYDSLQIAMERVKLNVGKANETADGYEVKLSMGSAIAETKEKLLGSVKLADNRMYEDKALRKR
jgi:diguanylate cyclase (GGDEF)-like protein